LLAGDEHALRQLPRGNWLGGTIPYFISHAEGGVASRDRIFVTDISGVVAGIEIAQYDQDSLARVYTEAPPRGFSFILIPGMSKAHLSFALNAPNYKGFGTHPLVGWIAGVHLDDLGRVRPKVFNGLTGSVIEEGALVLKATLGPGKVAEVGIINLFEQGDGDTLTFPADCYSAEEVLVNG